MHTKKLLFHHPGNSEENAGIIQKNDTGERAEEKCTNTEGNKKLGDSFFTSLCLLPYKPLRRIQP
jgi:hypothetical protein